MRGAGWASCSLDSGHRASIAWTARPPPHRPRRLLAGTVLCALLLTQALGLMHRVWHAHGPVPATASQAHAAPHSATAHRHAHEHPFERLFAHHHDQQDCKVFDQLTQADAPAPGAWRRRRRADERDGAGTPCRAGADHPGRRLPGARPSRASLTARSGPPCGWLAALPPDSALPRATRCCLVPLFCHATTGASGGCCGSSDIHTPVLIARVRHRTTSS